MPAPKRKPLALGALMVLNVFLCVLMGLSWRFSGRRGDGGPGAPSRFWSRHAPSESFWNREQQRLDLLHNPLARAALANDSFAMAWLSDPGPPDPCAPDWRVAMQVSDYNTLPQRLKDFLLHMRCRSYPVLIDQPLLCQREPFLLLAVKSQAAHFDRRQAIRQTWGRAGVFAGRRVSTVFLLGSSPPGDGHPDLRELLRHEAALHGDLLQWDYWDSFFNLTVKEVLFLRWLGERCPGARYVFKGDDDVFVNTPRIMFYLEGLPPDKREDLFVGHVISNAGPHRDRKLKYYVPESVFAGSYPPYAGGGGYLLSGGLALQLGNASRRVALYPIDDVYTGMCLRKLGMVPEAHGGFRTFDIDARQRGNPCAHRGLMVVHSRTPQEMLRIWPWVGHPELDCQ